MSDYQGNIVIKNPATPAGPSPFGAAPGMWKLSEVLPFVRQGVWPDANVDGYWGYTSLLLSTTSLSNANNNLFVDSSGAYNPVARNGNTTQGSFTPYGSLWSNYFDGSGDYLTVASNAAFGMGTGDFTIECWVNPSAFTGTGNVLVDMRSGTEPSVRPDLEYNSSGTLNYRVNGSTVISGGTLVIGTWSHVVVCRSGTTTKMFLNGTQVGSSYTDSNNYGSSAACRIGADDDGSPNAYVNGYMSNVRVVKGTAVYTSNFTVPTAPLTAISGTSLLTCQSNRFIDSSSNAFTITVNGDTKVTKYSPFILYPSAISYNQSDIQYWSGYFDGSGDYLYSPSNAAFGVGTGDFTIECWVYPTAAWASGGYNCILQIDGTGLYFGQNNAGFGLRQSGTANIISYGTSPTLNTWTHVAVVRSGTTVTMYYNGTSVATATSSANFSAGNAWVSSDATPGNYYTGYISNLRLVKGTAVYTGAFTPSTTPLTAISGTSLLTCQNAAFTDNSTNNFAITINGNTTVTGNNPFQTGNYSNYFSTTNSYLTGNASLSTSTSMSTFTIDGWVYPTSFSTAMDVIGDMSPTSASDTKVIAAEVNTSGQVALYWYDGGIKRCTGNTAMTLNQWNYFAIVVSSNAISIYVNKTTADTLSGTTTLTNRTQSYNCALGKYYTSNSSICYLSNIRVSTIARTISAVPTAAFSSDANTRILTCQAGRFLDAAGTVTFTPTTVAVQSYNPFYTSTIASNGGSMYFDGSGDYLSVPSSQGLNFGTSNWTIECWVYVSTRTANYPLIFGNNRGSFTTNALAITNSNSDSASYNDKFVFAWGSGGFSSPSAGTSSLLVANATNTKGTWYHFALVRESSTSVKMYRNGVQVANATISSSATFDWGYSGSFVGGGNWDGANSYFNGYISGLKATVGAALYTAAFTPPTAPVTPTAATTLLVNGMNAGIYDATAINDLETVGDAKVSTAVSKFGGSSMAFDGTGDQLVARTNNTLAGNFTIEGWIYLNSTSGIKSFCTIGDESSGRISFFFNGGVLSYNIFGGGTVGLGGSVSTGQWYHVAVVRSGSTITGYLNGTSTGTATQSGTLGNANAIYVSGISTGNDLWNGYIDDLRITNGVARYTANFTPPTAAFPTY